MADESLPPEYALERFVPERAVREHVLKIHGEEIPFVSVSEDYVFYDEKGAPEASIFAISYLKKDAAGRPVMFFWNGGPGSATSTLQMECFGPWQLAKDTDGKTVYGLQDADESILDICDLVFVDPVGVGYSRLLQPDKREKYYSVDGDARSVAFFIIEWMRRNRRWNDPVYICGESYGTVRACRVLAELGRSPYSESRKVPGIPVQGVILIGSAISMGSNPESLLEPGMELITAMMPAMAATNWYHHPKAEISQKDFVEQSWNFVREDLLGVLFAGDDCPQEKLESAAQKASYFTGLKKESLVKSRLHISSEEEFCMQVAADKGCRVDIYDSRVLSPLSGTYNVIGSADNVPLRVMNGLVAPRLGIAADRLYYTGNLTVIPTWNYDTEVPPAPLKKKKHIDCLRDAMKANPSMQVLFCSGLYDLCTHDGNTRYMLAHSGLPKSQYVHKEYFGGHGVYSSEEGKKQLFADVRELLGKCSI